MGSLFHGSCVSVCEGRERSRNANKDLKWPVKWHSVLSFCWVRSNKRRFPQNGLRRFLTNFKIIKIFVSPFNAPLQKVTEILQIQFLFLSSYFLRHCIKENILKIRCKFNLILFIFNASLQKYQVSLLHILVSL